MSTPCLNIWISKCAKRTYQQWSSQSELIYLYLIALIEVTVKMPHTLTRIKKKKKKKIQNQKFNIRTMRPSLPLLIAVSSTSSLLSLQDVRVDESNKNFHARTSFEKLIPPQPQPSLQSKFISETVENVRYEDASLYVRQQALCRRMLSGNLFNY